MEIRLSGPSYYGDVEFLSKEAGLKLELSCDADKMVTLSVELGATDLKDKIVLGKLEKIAWAIKYGAVKCTAVKTIPAIKFVRIATGWGLEEAKDFVDAI